MRSRRVVNAASHFRIAVISSKLVSTSVSIRPSRDRIIGAAERFRMARNSDSRDGGEMIMGSRPIGTVPSLYLTQSQKRSPENCPRNTRNTRNETCHSERSEDSPLDVRDSAYKPEPILPP